MRSIVEMIAAIKDLQKRVSDLELKEESELAHIHDPAAKTNELSRGEKVSIRMKAYWASRKNAQVEGSDG